MGTRTRTRGDEPAPYTDDGLRTEIARVEMRLAVLRPSNAAQRRSLESRLRNLRREQISRAD